MAAAIIIMLVSAATYALAFVMQHKGTQAAIGDGAANAGVKTLVKNPIWLIGVLLLTPAFILHLVALGFGSVAVVQPLIVTELIFIPPLSALISKAKISGRDWICIIAITLGLGGFLVIAQPTHGDPDASLSGWIIATGAVLLVMALCYVIGARQKPVVRATLYGCSAGLANTLLAIFAAGAAANLAKGGAVLTDPLAYLTIIAALATISTNAIAFKSGPITASTPAMIAINPIASVIISMALFGVVITSSIPAVIGILICVLVVGYAIIQLTNSDAVHGSAESEGELAEEAVEAVEHLPHPRHHKADQPADSAPKPTEAAP